MHARAAIVTVGSELVEGLRVDTNTAEIAREVARRGFKVAEAVSVGDEAALLSATMRRLAGVCDLVVVTGGLGPTHDDVTRQAGANAFGRQLRADSGLVAFLEPVVARHSDPRSAAGVLGQALVLEGAEVVRPTSGTASGQILTAGRCAIALLPGPPVEMRAMLAVALARFAVTRAAPVELGVAGMPESDVQHAAQRALAGFPGIELAVLAKPGDVRVVLLDAGAGEAAVARASQSVCAELEPACYSVDGSTLAEVVVREAVARGVTLAAGESCTGGLVGASITDVPGSSEVFLGSAFTYSNRAKSEILGVDSKSIAASGAVSAEIARAMAEGARVRFGADIAVATTGVAGPGGGTAEKPVGLVWFAVATQNGVRSVERRGPGASRAAVRAGATATALHLLLTELRRV
jgi:nicotinamide-nucleotide amidase